MSIENHAERLTDALLKDRIARSLRHHLPSLRHVIVEVRGGTVELRGQVNSFYAKQLLQHIARRLAGDSRVIDKVSVVTAAGFRDPLRLRQSAAAGVALLLVLFASCSKQPTLVEVHPVSGQVLFDGKPAAGATVVFHPRDRSNTFPTPSAKTDHQGNFSLTTYTAHDGAPIGAYAVTVELRPWVTKDGELQLGPNALPQQYSSPKTTKVEARVAEGANNLPIKIVR